VSINSFRSMLYKLARTAGDVQAVQKGRVVHRAVRRVAGRLTARLLSKVFR
jgi:hypothetical protein